MNNDLISREALKKAIDHLQYTDDFCVKHQIDNSISLCVLEKIIDNAPTVNDCPNCEYKLESDYIRSSSSYKELIDLRKFKEENTRPQGKWILCEDTHFSKCSICGDIWLNEECWNYCSNCGADMRPTETLSETAGKVADDCLNRIMGGGI